MYCSGRSAVAPSTMCCLYQSAGWPCVRRRSRRSRRSVVLPLVVEYLDFEPLVASFEAVELRQIDFRHSIDHAPYGARWCTNDIGLGRAVQASLVDF